MKKVLLLNASPVGIDARGYQLALQAVANLQERGETVRLVIRDFASQPATPLSTDYVDAIIGRHAHDVPAFAESEALIRELEEADYLVIATPMHNFTVPASLKLWIDYVLRAGRSFGAQDGRKIGLLADRPALVIVSTGGPITAPHAKQPDHLTGYLTDVLATLGIADVRFIYLETLVVPEIAAQAIAAGEIAVRQDARFGVALAA